MLMGLKNFTDISSLLVHEKGGWNDLPPPLLDNLLFQ